MSSKDRLTVDLIATGTTASATGTPLSISWSLYRQGVKRYLKVASTAQITLGSTQLHTWVLPIPTAHQPDPVWAQQNVTTPQCLVVSGTFVSTAWYYGNTSSTSMTFGIDTLAPAATVGWDSVQIVHPGAAYPTGFNGKTFQFYAFMLEWTVLF